MQKVFNAIQRVRFTNTLRHASFWDKKGLSLGKILVKPRHQRSQYAIKFEDRSHEEPERQERCVQSKAWDLANNIFTSSKRTTRLHSSRPRKNGNSRLRQQKSRRRESLWLIPGRVCIWSVRKTLTLLSWRP